MQTVDTSKLNDEEFMLEINRRLKVLISEIEKKFLEREELVRMLFLTIMSKSNAFLIGLPGLAKTDILTKICASIEKYVWYQKLFTDETKENQIFGPFKTHNDGTITYVTRGMLPEANFAFLDEVFKSPKELLDSMLEIINEKRFKNGPDIVSVPLYSVFAASNEFPKQADSPFFDRLHFRYQLHDLKSKESFRRFMNGDFDRTTNVSEKISLEIIDRVQSLKSKVTFPESILQTLEKLWKEYEIVKIRISTRTWGFIREILKVSAVCNARTEVNYSDLFVMLWICWNNYRQKEENEKLIHRVIFGTKESIDSLLIQHENDLALFESMLIEYNPFLNHLVDTRSFDEVGFLNIRDKIMALFNKVSEVKESLDLIHQRLLFCLGVENQCKQNIFLMPIQNRVFDKENTALYQKYRMRCEQIYNFLDNWLRNNKTKVDYANQRYYKNYAISV